MGLPFCAVSWKVLPSFASFLPPVDLQALSKEAATTISIYKSENWKMTWFAQNLSTFLFPACVRMPWKVISCWHQLLSLSHSQAVNKRMVGKMPFSGRSKPYLSVSTYLIAIYLQAVKGQLFLIFPLPLSFHSHSVFSDQCFHSPWVLLL